MPRQLKLRTNELGDLNLFLIYQYGDTWEESWKAAQNLPLTALFTVVTKELMTHALAGWTAPLVKALGIPPEGAIRKLSVQNQTCERKALCPFFQRKECLPTSPKMPWCFEPGGIEDPNSRGLAVEVIRLWRLGTHIIVVVQPLEDGALHVGPIRE